MIKVYSIGYVGWLDGSSVVDVFSVAVTRTWDRGDLLYFLFEDSKWVWVSNFCRSISCGVAQGRGDGLVSGFREFSANVGGGVIFAGGLVAGLSLYGVWALS